MKNFFKNIVAVPNSCWKWSGLKSIKGYGKFKDSNYLDWRAHRASYTIYVGEIPKGMMVCHHCDNPECCNPSHLFLGTARDNSIDRVNKGRFSPHRNTLGKFV